MSRDIGTPVIAASSATTAPKDQAQRWGGLPRAAMPRARSSTSVAMSSAGGTLTLSPRPRRSRDSTRCLSRRCGRSGSQHERSVRLPCRRIRSGPRPSISQPITPPEADATLPLDELTVRARATASVAVRFEPDGNCAGQDALAIIEADGYHRPGPRDAGCPHPARLDVDVDPGQAHALASREVGPGLVDALLGREERQEAQLLLLLRAPGQQPGALPLVGEQVQGGQGQPTAFQVDAHGKQQPARADDRDGPTFGM